ncbi:MAG: hypothetical protein RL326_1587 [Pseudomonadota bacterium]
MIKSVRGGRLFTALQVMGAVIIPVLATTAAYAEELPAIFKKVQELAEQKNYAGAMKELSWAQQELEKLHQQRLTEILPAEVDGFKGEKPEVQSAMGFTTLEREYSKGEQRITFSISGGTGNEAMAGLAGFAKMGAMMGGVQPGVDKVRLGSLTATLDTTDSPEMTVFLDSGSVVTLKTGDGVDGAALKKFAEGLKLTELDSYLKGSKA